MIIALLKMWWLILAIIVIPAIYAYYEERGGVLGMWIRSQDKKRLIKSLWIVVNGLIIQGDCGTSEGSFWDLGKYETNERALEVLDEIERDIQYIEFAKLKPDKTGVSSSDFVYHMPEK